MILMYGISYLILVKTLAKLRKKVDFVKQFWRINATKCIDKGISRKNEAIRSEGSTQITADLGKSVPKC